MGHWASGVFQRAAFTELLLTKGKAVVQDVALDLAKRHDVADKGFDFLAANKHIRDKPFSKHSPFQKQ